MRTLRKTLLVLTGAIALIGLATTANAFHDGGVAECSGCHSMHDANSSPLLAGSDASSTCLGCHESPTDTGPRSYHISSIDQGAGNPPLQRTPGGDFGWLRKTYTTTASYGRSLTNDGDTHGHNIIAIDNGYAVDGNNAIAPGSDGFGTGFDSNNLGCNSCHDPHGQARRLPDNSVISPVVAQGNTYPPIEESGSYGAIPDAGYAVGVYRLLWGSNRTAYDARAFAGVPAAVVPSSYNRTEAVTQTRTSYGRGTSAGYSTWGRWCGTCHAEMHSSEASGIVHVTDTGLSSVVRNRYNWYVKTGDLTGTDTTSFTSLVPFFKNTADAATLAGLAVNDDSVLNGPAAGDQVSCFSCHRAHASAWEYALRWNGASEFLTLADAAGNPIYPAADDTTNGTDIYGQYHLGYSEAEMEAAYYDRPATVFAGYQRSLCNKCHIKD